MDAAFTVAGMFVTGSLVNSLMQPSATLITACPIPLDYAGGNIYEVPQSEIPPHLLPGPHSTRHGSTPLNMYVYRRKCDELHGDSCNNCALYASSNGRPTRRRRVEVSGRQ